MKITFSNIEQQKAPSPGKSSSQALVIGVGEDLKLSPLGRPIDQKLSSAIIKTLGSGRFTGKRGQFINIPAPAKVEHTSIIVMGLGKAKELKTKDCESLGFGLVKFLNEERVKHADILIEEWKGLKLDVADAAANIAFGAKRADYRFDKYFTKQKAEDKPSLGSLKFQLSNTALAKKGYAPLEKVAEGIAMTRDLANEPPNILYPETMAAECKTLSKLGVTVQVLSESQMKKLGMGALLGVGQGSDQESKLVIMQWNGSPSKGKKEAEAPVAFVGKGVTFDTGGISIKPSSGMEEMKMDMHGAATVIGLMKALAGRKAKVNAVGVVGLVENMPSGNAQRPSDIVTTMSGQTVEVLNTDAEGRLVLADALWYTQDRFKPKFMIDLATLTGAVIVALGTEHAGIFSNDDTLCKQLSKMGEATDEKVWRLPLGEAYDKTLKSHYADMQNTGAGRDAGSITAAQFLQRFVNDTPWVHIDIAGTAMTWAKKDKSTGATGYGVKLLDRLVAEYYEA